jgi:hypothetical protein
MNTVQAEFSAVSLAYPDAQLITYPDGTYLVVLPAVALPPGWCQESTHIRFVVPAGYPYASPDCFWADPGLRLQTGAMPQNAQVGNVAPGQPDPSTLWFSWHLSPGSWAPGVSDLMTFIRVIKKRFESLQ